MMLSKNLTVVEREGEWRFVPPDAWKPLYDNIYDIAEALDYQVPIQELRPHRKWLNSAVTLFPDWVQAYLLLSDINFRLGNREAAIADAQTGIDICLNCFPNREIPKKAKIDYYIIDNRPFFRTFYRRALYYFLNDAPIERRSNVEKALRLSSLLLSLHPSDNVGARTISLPCALELRKYQKVLGLTSDWKDTTCPDALYARSLAVFAMKKTDLADRTIAQAIRWHPLVAKALLRPDIANPYVGSPSYTSGGADEALLYRDAHRLFWIDVTGALDWLASKQSLIAEAEAELENLRGGAFAEKSKYPDIYRLV